jgi:hypothetical protein
MTKKTTASRAKGRTSITKSTNADIGGKHKSHRHTDNERKTQQARGISSGRGDRRDMSKTYTNNAKHASRGNTPRKDVSTRAR